MTFWYRWSSKLVLLIVLLITLDTYSQKLEFITKLPPKIDESSGVEIAGTRSIWTFNDSGVKSELYECDLEGNLVRTLDIDKANHRDWEDIAKDDRGNIYIGDIGNNNNDSKKLRIFKISISEAVKGDKAPVETISFHFEDQNKYPLSKMKMNWLGKFTIE